METIIPHELGHSVFHAYTRFFDSTGRRDGYGSPAPDWLDEAPAVWMESRQRRAMRLQRIVRSTPSLRTLVTMPHPGTGSIRADQLDRDFDVQTRIVVPPCPACTFLPDSVRNKFRMTQIGINARGRVDTIVSFSDRSPHADDTFEAREFYALSYSLLLFVHQRGGPPAVRELLRRHRNNAAPDVDVFAALPGLPESPAAFEQAWHAFLVNPELER
jgi:hypothetical protein